MSTDSETENDAGQQLQSSKAVRVSWTHSETEALIQLWEENIGNLRRQKVNGPVYEAIVTSLEALGVSKTKQVHAKVENLAQQYSRVCRGATTGSGSITSPYNRALPRFLGPLPLKDHSLVEESTIQEEHAGQSVLEIVSKMERGCSVATSRSMAQPASQHALSPENEHCSSSSSNEPTVLSYKQWEYFTRATTPEPKQHPVITRGNKQSKEEEASCQSCGHPKNILLENRKLRAELSEARAKEYDLRAKQVALQEEANQTQKCLVRCLEKIAEK